MSVLDGAAKRSFHAVVSNPPYIPSADIDGLQTEIRDHEPRQALTPGIDGLGIIRRLLMESQRLLTEDGYWPWRSDSIRAKRYGRLPAAPAGRG